VAAIIPLFARVWAASERTGHAGRTVTVKIKYADFQQITRSRSAPSRIASQVELEQFGLDLLRPHFPPSQGVRLIGVTVSNFLPKDQDASPQLTLALS
jgi:DNA polymerase-4